MHRLNRWRIAAASIVSLLGSSAADAATSWQFTTGSEYSTGKFGSSASTDVVVVPFSARLKWNAWTLRASVPYVYVQGPADVTVVVDDHGGGDSSSSGSGNSGSGSSNSGGSDDGSGETETETETEDRFAADRNVSGIGDASLALSYSFDDIAGTPAYLDVTGKLKFATGSESQGLGVGATDYAALSELGWDAGTGGAYVNAGRRFLGHSSTLDRVDGWQAGVGAWINLGTRIELGADYSWRDASVVGSADPSALEATTTLRLTPTWRVVASAGAGLSDGSPDFFGGLSLSWNSDGARR
ncbi:hypothetical protein [Hydrocarboniphaga sp.]|uniref:hypothetical protein n=1 Tax=Hydrocarboniphaga sp. TaxID=2033016 RepID=UPI003D0C26B8